MADDDIISRFEEFVRENCYEDLLSLVKLKSQSLFVDFKKLELFEPELADTLLEKFEDTIKLFEKAVEMIDLPVEKGKIFVRLVNVPENLDIRIANLRSESLEGFISLKGLIKQTSVVRPIAKSVVFECPACNSLIDVKQEGVSEIKEPKMCKCGRKGRFVIKEKELVDFQKIVLEECPEILEGGEQAKKIDVFLKDDLVDPTLQRKVVPGSKVRIYGYIKEIPIRNKRGAPTTIHNFLMEANNLESVDKTYEDIKITPAEVEEIKKLSKDQELFDIFVKSIAPSIYGYNQIKQSLVLQLFGGVRKKKPDNTFSRGDIHIMLVGDPGTGKSQLLRNVTSISPKGMLVTGTGTSGAGLTASVIKDEILGGWTLEAGSIVLANKGILAIDEIDKMNKDDRVAMHEAMEQQTVSISKANIHATLRSETSVLAAANPKMGRFDPYKSVGEQIILPLPLINRFDLIFIVRDIPSKEHDEKVASHILEMHRDPNENKPALEPDFFRKYIAYSKEHANPILSPGAIRIIQDFYVSMRNKVTEESEVRSIPISARQLEALVRLSEAYARMKLSKEVSVEDANKAIELVQYSLKQVSTDYETGEIDIDRLVTGITATQRKRIADISKIIEELEGKHESRIVPIDELINKCKEAGLDEGKVKEMIETMKRNGEIFEPKAHHIKRVG